MKTIKGTKKKQVSSTLNLIFGVLFHPKPIDVDTNRQLFECSTNELLSAWRSDEAFTRKLGKTARGSQRHLSALFVDSANFRRNASPDRVGAKRLSIGHVEDPPTMFDWMTYSLIRVWYLDRGRWGLIASTMDVVFIDVLFPFILINNRTWFLPSLGSWEGDCLISDCIRVITWFVENVFSTFGPFVFELETLFTYQSIALEKLHILSFKWKILSWSVRLIIDKNRCSWVSAIYGRRPVFVNLRPNDSSIHHGPKSNFVERFKGYRLVSMLIKK